MDREKRTRSFCQSFIFKIYGVLLMLHLQSGSVCNGVNYIIDTTAPEISVQHLSPSPMQGKIENRTFHGPNNGTWKYSVAAFNLSAEKANVIFSAKNNIYIRGTHALSVTVQGNFTVNTELDVSGQEVNFTSDDKPLFRLGGFVRVNKSCCTLGAGPGGAFSYHGGGHGGRGGGFYQDRNTSKLYGWSYYDTSYLLGGSTGTILFSSKSGSGGGAIELIAVNGILTINATIKADGYSSGNTSDEHCAGGSSGGLIRLQADEVVIGSNVVLSAVGGDSGYSMNHSHYCGGGGGGGVIQVFTLTNNTNYMADSSKNTRGGHGIQNGEEGMEDVAVYFDKEMDLTINTSTCQMVCSGNHWYRGYIETREFQPAGKNVEHDEVCTIDFTSSIFIGQNVRVHISGQRALSLVSRHGNIEINSPLNISGSALSLGSSVQKSIGGYVKTSEDGRDAGPAKFSNCSGSADLYGRNFEALFGGSVCLSSNTNTPINAVGGGAIELTAKNGAIAVAAAISADGFSDTDKAGAMGGTIRLLAKEVILRRNGLLTARGSHAGGGVIQIRSDADVQGMCESKFDVTGNTAGFVNILVSTKNTFQVQYINQGILEIDTTNARWMHKLSSNGSMAYSYFGETEIKEIPDAHPPYSAPYSIAKFEFQTPILINGSAEVKVSGLHSLFVSSKEGIYIGVNIDVGKAQLAVDKNVGGFCVSAEKANEGNGPGRGWNDTNAGAGHGGKGGLLFENNERIYGATYGTDSDISLIGGSTGTTKEDTDSVIACGGGAIKIYTEKNLTINAKIRANGKTLSVLQKSSSGGSSGGTIILESKKHVILGDNSRLEAQGADAVKATNDMESSRGGGGGGVIGIFHKEGLVGNKPTPTENTKGGNGTRKGDNGLVVINGTRTYGYPAVVIEENYVGCVNVIPSFSSPQKYSLKAHEAAPSKCIEECLKHKFHFAFIQNKDCWCSNANLTMVHAHKGNETRCNARCWSNSSLICGGDSGLSAYKTGYISSSAATILSSATTVVSAVFPSKASVVAVPSSSVSQITPAPTEPTKHTKPTEVAVPSSSVSPITPVPTEPTEVAVPSSSVSPITPVPTEPTEVAVPSSSVSPITPVPTKPTEVAVPSSSVSPITPVPTEPTEVPKPTDEPTTRSPTEPSEKFKEVANVTITEKNVVNVVGKLKNLTSEKQMNGGDTKVVLEILNKITNNESLLPKDQGERQKLGQSILEVASSLLSEENVDSWGVPTQNENNTGKEITQTQVLELVENIGLKIGEQLGNNASIVFESANIAMGVETRIPDESAQGAEYPNYDELGSEWQGLDRVFVHRELFDEMATDNSSRTTVVYALYNHVSEHFPANLMDKQSSKSMIVNSRILALKFNKQPVPPFKKPIKLWFDKLKTENVTKPSCSFVDFKKDGGTWSNTGCHMVTENDLNVECGCDHLTNFAILMQIKEFEIPEEHLKALTVITYVGCGISLFGLALTLATFLSLETLASERTSIHKNLVVAIGLAQIVFLAGIDATYNPIACKAVALFLHYLYTAAFTWMLCEGIHLYSKVVEVFSEGSKMKYYYALGWGLPLTIVFISACSRWGGYGNERACWISINDGLIWAFVAPVLIIMTINFFVMIMVIKVIIASVTSLQNPGNTSQVRAGVKGMLVLLPLLGLTWVFGLMAINKETIVFQYLFAILNSLQGLFIFAFHCVGNTEVRVAYKRLHEKRTLAKSLPEHSLSSSHHSSREKRRMDSHETYLTGDDDIIVTKTIRSVSDVKISGDNMAMQTFGDADSGRWSLNCPSPDPFFDLEHAKRA